VVDDVLPECDQRIAEDFVGLHVIAKAGYRLGRAAIGYSQVGQRARRPDDAVKAARIAVVLAHLAADIFPRSLELELDDGRPAFWRKAALLAHRNRELGRASASSISAMASEVHGRLTAGSGTTP
jgi:hypothetical protein